MNKKVLAITALPLIMLLAFSGCSKADNPVPDGAAPTQDAQPAAAPTEAPSEAPVTDPTLFTTNSIMKLTEELIVKYPEEKPEHVRALLLMANLDRINEADVKTLFDNYGFTYETLDETYREFHESFRNSCDATFATYEGGNDERIGANFSTRIHITDVVLYEEDKPFAEMGQKYIRGYVLHYDSGVSFSSYEETYEKRLSDGLSFAECVIDNYANAPADRQLDDGSMIPFYYSPYEECSHKIPQ